MGQLQWRLWLMGAATFLLGNTSATRPPGGCHTDEFQCRLDALCIPMSWHCDGSTDCMDSSDEKNCEGVTRVCDPNLKFVCKDSAQCISKAWVCDGDNDCEDNSDEENCESLVCKPPSHTCANTSICLPPEKLCDGNDDCGDGSDEGQLCATRPPGGCHTDEFQCQLDALCIPMSWHCDGSTDCMDSSDEKNCEGVTRVCDPNVTFVCKDSAQCISKAWVCDGDNDCEDNSDEENCESLVCKPPSHTCANTSICLPPEKLCDGNDDCGDGSDEGQLCGTASFSHSLLYFRHALLLEGQPQFVEVTYLDSQPIQHYDSNTKRMRPLTLWINQTLDEDYWTWESNMNNFEEVFLEKLQELHPTVPQKHHNQSKDHTLQCIEGCKLTANGDEIEIHQDAFDGKKMRKRRIFHTERSYLDGNCILWLNRYLAMKPQKKELPIVEVTHQEVSINNLQTLTCQAYGFYPKEISARWRKDGEIFNQTNSSVHIVPNSDGTFNARLSILINPKERNLYRCHVEHVSSSEPLDFVLQKRGPSAEVTAHVLNINDTLLNCSICNFYPEDIDATWMKDGENWDQETFHGDIIRNWDGTYCTWISIEINPMEEYRYCCYVEHEGLQEPPCVKVRIPTEENFQLLLIICCVVAVLVFFILSTIIGILWYKKRRRDYRPAAKSDPNSSLDNAEKCPLKEIEGVPPLNNTAGEESKGDIPNSQDTREKKQPPENHQISI